MRRAVLAVVLSVAACSPDDTLATTTSESVITTVPATTTLPSPTTTTLTSTTTTTLPPTTTTSSAGLEGNWADQPLITTGFGALGWWDGNVWLWAEEEGELPVVGGEDYQVAALGPSAVITGGPQDLVCEPLGLLGVDLVGGHLLGEWPGPYGVAISAAWEVQPHLFESFIDNGTYAEVARGLLAERGLVVPNPRIKQLYRTDLEGDGVNEVLVVAEDIQGSYFPRVGDYSIVFLRKIVEGTVETAILGESVITDEDSFVIGFSVGGVADLNGDAKMEVVISAAYYEGLGVEVWEYVDDDLGPTLQLSLGCGS